MLNKTSKLVVTSLITLLITAGLSFAQEETSKEQNHGDMKSHNMNHETKMDSCKMMMNHEAMMDSCKMMKDNMNMDHEAMMDSCKMKMMKDGKDMDHKSMMSSDHKGMTENKNSIVREGVIDLAVIDENGDGKVYQDQMCWNVVSDESGDCPQCGMKLKEVTLDKAKTNLEKNGFKVKG